MSFDVARRPSVSSPPTSGRSSPVPRATRRTVEGDLFRADKSLRRYGATIERVLATWEISPEEWADYIAFLARLLKAIQTRPHDAPLLPHSKDIATRLAQCLNPALPSGVHSKSLEVYAYIFSTFGNSYVSAHLHEFLPGLAAVLSFASLSVRPAIYELFEDHVVRLSRSDLRPALKAIVLGLLPALEEGQGDDFERTFGILRSLQTEFTPEQEDSVASDGHDGYFWQCLFLAVVTSPTRRQGALNYMLRTLPKFPSRSKVNGATKEYGLVQEVECIVSPEPGLLVRCFVAGLSDDQVLVQRGFLDLMVSNIPLDSTIIQERVGADDTDRLVTAASHVILRKDMSLNRRLWSWFLGPEPKEQAVSSQASSPEQETKPSYEGGDSSQLRYFSSYGRASLERCVLDMLQRQNNSAAAQARPFRILSSLMDRWEIGGLLVSKVFLPAMESLFDYSRNNDSISVAEVVRSAHTFFDGVEASLIWDRLLSVLRNALERGTTPERNLQLFSWVLETFNVKDEEMTTVHIPMMMLYLASHLESGLSSLHIQAKVIVIMTKLLDLVPDRALKVTAEMDESARKVPLDLKEPAHLRNAVQTFYTSDASNRLPYNLGVIIAVIAAGAISASVNALSHQEPGLFSKAITLRVAISERSIAGAIDSPLLAALSETFSADSTNQIPFQILSATITFISTGSPSSQYFTALEPALTAQIWQHLSPQCPKYHVEAVRALWQLVEISSDAVRASVLDLVKRALDNDDAEGCRRFTILWQHSATPSQLKAIPTRRGSAMKTTADNRTASRALEFLVQPLLLALDALNDNTSIASQVIRSWIQRSSSLDQIFGLLFRELKTVGMIDESELPSVAERERRRKHQQRKLFNVLGYFTNVLRAGNRWVWDRLAAVQIPAVEEDTELGGAASIVESCMRWLESSLSLSITLRRRLIAIIHMVIASPDVPQLTGLDLDVRLLGCLTRCVSGDTSELQGELLSLVQLALERQPTKGVVEQVSLDHRSPTAGPRRSNTASVSRSSTSVAASAPAQLFQTLRLGFSAPQARSHLDQWLEFFIHVLPQHADAVLANLIPLVETLCGELNAAHRQLVDLAASSASTVTISPDYVAVSLLEGLEILLDRAYECLLSESDNEPAPKEPETRQNFFSNVASGVFRTDSPVNRSATTNSRLTVILSFQDTIRTCMDMWLWASNASETPGFDVSSAATTAYNALKVRNKTRHALEQVFSLEPLEGLEVVIARWWSAPTDSEAASALNLLHVMQVTRPKSVVPAILDALCTRTNPSSIPTARHSSLTLDLEPAEVATFFSAYLDSMEDDAMDEVWQDCLAFLRDVLANPLPYRQVLSQLLSIVLLLAEKLSNTNFGEQRKMRRDLGDLFQRLLTATFTTLPSGYVSEQASTGDQIDKTQVRRDRVMRSMTLMPVLERITARVELILDTPERVAPTVNSISQALVGPVLRSKSFPSNVTKDLLDLIVHMSRKAPGSKSWKKEVGDAFNDPRLLGSTPDLVESGWFEVLHQWSLHDKERMPELLSRLAPPSSAGIMFGVGASAARQEADRRTQLNLRRISILLLASPEDTYVAHLRTIEEKLAELFAASPASSPSATIKAELFLLCRAIALSLSSFHLSPLWPIINDNLQDALNSLYPGSAGSEQFSNLTILQACRLLDLLIALSPDEFQLHQWLYITDTIDAVYHPHDWAPAGLTDQVAEALGTSSVDGGEVSASQLSSQSRRRQLMNDDIAGDKDDIKAMARDDFVRSIIRPFLSQLSIHAYEGVYSLDAADLGVLRRSVLVDLLDLGSVVE